MSVVDSSAFSAPPVREDSNQLMANPVVGDDHPRTRSRKRAEQATQPAEENALKRQKEEIERAALYGGLDTLNPSKPAKRRYVFTH